MDSFTHFAIGACMGEVFAGKTLGKKAMLWGALAQSVPDIDFIASSWMNIPSALLAHRGFTHSFLFCAIITPLFSLIAEKLHRPHNISFKQWNIFFGVAIFFHIFIDAFNNYGVGWLEPFSHLRVSFNAIYVADPFFSAGPLIATFVLVAMRSRKPARKFWSKMGLTVSSLYLLYCLFNKAKTDHDIKAVFQQQHIGYSRYFSTPAPLQNWLWYIVAGSDSGYYVGYRSVFDKDNNIDFEFFPRNEYLLKPVQNHEDLQQLVRFSKQFYSIEKWNDTLVFNDLRFGQVIGWENPRAKFVFHYFLQQPESNALVVQRGRFEGWSRGTFFKLIKRAAGKK